MNLLLDTNIFLEVLLGQQEAEHAARLLSNPQMMGLFMTDFSLHSIGVLLFRRHRFGVFVEFVGDLDKAGIKVLSLHPWEISALAEPASHHNLDFDDAYQYEIAKRFSLTLVSFDTDFDKTDLERTTPREILARSGQ